ncbi:hypothetical protein NQ318_013537 [Aromia moschata]|uniref:Uncharacterized protein n=1 Tax=Aromia moschata TaxID=1265417 RepID=A0AAV8XXW1_9CUCU|nr:hypothetical protein NQ318_013537 [Aromia moschata]
MMLKRKLQKKLYLKALSIAYLNFTVLICKFKLVFNKNSGLIFLINV